MTPYPATMTTTVPDTLLAELDALKSRAAADPTIATSVKRTQRIGTIVTLLRNAAADCTPAQLGSVTALLHPDTIGHPDEDDTILGRAKDGRYRARPPYGDPLTAATQRAVMDGIADLNRAAGHPPYWWEQRGMRPWSKHTREPLDHDGHIVLRRALSESHSDPSSEPFRLRLLAALELFWDTGVPPEGLIRADTTSLTPKLSSIRLTINPPGRTEAVVGDFPLSANTRAALRLWLPVRRAVVAQHLEAGPDHPANQALFITLKATTGTYDDGSPRLVPPGLRITRDGLETNYALWARRLNAEYYGQVGWPVPTTLQQLTRAGAANRKSRT